MPVCCPSVQPFIYTCWSKHLLFNLKIVLMMGHTKLIFLVLMPFFFHVNKYGRETFLLILFIDRFLKKWEGRCYFDFILLISNEVPWKRRGMAKELKENWVCLHIVRLICEIPKAWMNSVWLEAYMFAFLFYLPVLNFILDYMCIVYIWISFL